ncbi:hypothetical protein [Phenylobacterium sp.]|uniref:hypothetical protein n=1 Tax=Phenylobacterium sp. TaxID=1871053 RepID=UPI0027346CCA|nr:hypothetical protein [Phenylobacterium sp.]MDP3660659.1 hypothetical protein [Phenylobacterium sp.]
MAATSGLSAAEQAGRRLGVVEWLALALCIGASAYQLHTIFAPGFMSFDSLLFYEEAIDGVTRSTWPPAYAYLIQITRALGGDYGALFLAQTAMVFGFGGYLTMRLAAGSSVRRLLALVLFMAAFIAVPPLLGTMIVLWNAVPVAGFMLAGAVFQLAGARGQRIGWALAAILAYATCFALRYNSVFLIGPEMLLLLAFPLGARSTAKHRITVATVALVAFAIALVSFSHRLPDLKPLPFNAGVRTIQSFDLIGVSALCGESFLTPEMTAKGPVSIAAVRRHYDPRHLNVSLADRPGVASIVKPADADQVDAAWRRAVAAHPGCYLKHRWAVFTEQMGAAPGGLFYATHGGIDPNRFGFVLDNPEQAQRAAVAISQSANDPLRRPVWLYLGAVAAVLWLALRRDVRALPLGLLTLSALAYAGSHLFIAAAADARYIFPSNVLCVVVIAAALGGRQALLTPAGRR